MKEDEIRDFWDANPCGETLIGGVAQNYMDFFERYDAYRYKTERHILSCLDEIDFRGKRVLEVGLGQGADAEQIIRRGGIWSGLDVTKAAVDRTRLRLETKQLKFSEIKQGSLTNCPFSDDCFDIVYSHGALHHIPDICSAQNEIHRVLQSNGKAIIMVYAKNSLNYQVSIKIFRRIGLILLYLFNLNAGGFYSDHLTNAKKVGIRNYLKMDKFIHVNTDGPNNPYSKVYDVAEIKKSFPNFHVVSTRKFFMHAPPFPVNRLPGASLMGWHLWATLIPK